MVGLVVTLYGLGVDASRRGWTRALAIALAGVLVVLVLGLALFAVLGH
ncbi:MAG: hypothetical protein AABM40_04720 [Chloroflexota bacterium]